MNRFLDDMRLEVVVDHDEVVLRFAVHAPSIPDWFEPVMPPKPKEPRPPKIKGKSSGKWLQVWLSDPTQDLRSTLPGTVSAEAEKILDDFERRYREWENESVEWRAEYRIQRMAQWPWFYAKSVARAPDFVSKLIGGAS